MAMHLTTKRLRRCARYLREHCPADAAIHVRRVRLDGVLGDCGFGKRGYIIRLDNRLPWFAAYMVLAHEWAHAISWHAPGPDHGSAFGRGMAKVETALEEYDHDG